LIALLIKPAYDRPVFDHCLYFNTSALARRLDREWSLAFAGFGLTPPQGFMLRVVLERPGLLQSQLADALSIARATATRTVDGLVRLELVERRATEGDGREVAVYPTAAGRRLRNALTEASGAVTARLKASLGSGEFADVVGKIRGVRSALG
jgi:DNA-binding MarR family transcriptional regulator